MQPYFNECNSKYSLLQEETAPHQQSLVMTGQSSPDSNITYLSPWVYTSSGDLKGLTFMGQWSMYPGGGYVIELGDSQDGARSLLQELFSNRWLDRYTRAVFVEFTLYNPNVNLFTVAHLLAEYGENSAMITYIQLDHLTLYDYQTPSAVFRLVCEIIFLLFLFYQIIVLVRGWWKHKAAHWKVGILTITELTLYQHGITNM